MTWSAPSAYLYGWSTTDYAGHKTLKLGANTITLSGGHQRFPNILKELDTALNPYSWDVSTDSLGRVVLSGPSAVIEWTDHLGWLLGFDRLAGETESATTSLTARVVAPACLPLYGASWEQIDLEQEREVVVDRTLRSHAYVYGGARVWRWTLRMPHQAVTALRTGWLQRGKVTLSADDYAAWFAGTPTAWSGSNPSGYVDAYMVGIQKVDWLNDMHDAADVTLIVTTAS